VFVADAGNGIIQEFTTSGTYINEWGHLGDGTSRFNNVTGVASGGALYVTDVPLSGGVPRVMSFTGSGTLLRQWGSAGSGDGQFLDPVGLAASVHGDVFVADRGNHRIQKFDPYGNYELQWGTYGTGNGQFLAPAAVAIDDRSYEVIYVADTDNNVIQKFGTSSGTSTSSTTWGRLKALYR